MAEKRANPAVSVVIPTFNRGSRIRNAIDSVLGQTCKDYEIIVVDDGSTDGTAEMLAPYENKICYLRQSNRGVSEARNRGIEAARGEWIATLDSDDVWLPQKLRLQLQGLAQCGSKVGLCFTNCFRASSGENGATFFDEAGFHVSDQWGILRGAIDYIFARNYLFHTSSLMIARHLIQESGGFDTEMTVAEDTDLMFRLCFKTNFCFVNVPLVRVNDLSAGGADRLTDHIKAAGSMAFESKLYMYDKWLRLVSTNSEIRERVIHARGAACLERLISLIRKRSWAQAARLIGRMANLEGSFYVAAPLLLKKMAERSHV